jgi:transcriptional regulator with XRE-family HTH domain
MLAELKDAPQMKEVGYTNGKTLRHLRLGRGWSQRDLAQISGVTQSTICRLECGRHPPNISTVRRLAMALDVSPSLLVV